MRKVLSIFDLVLIFSLTGGSLLGLIYMDRLIPGGDSVRIEVNGELKGIYPLNEDRIVELNGPLGKTIVEIRDKKVRVVDSPCPNKFCIHQGFVSKGSIICLPNRVVIIIGGEQGIDAITG